MTAASLIAQLIAALGGLGAIGALLRIRGERAKLQAEAERIGADSAEAVSRAAVALLDPSRQQTAWLTAQLSEARQQIHDLTAQLTVARGEVARLSAEVKQLRKD